MSALTTVASAIVIGVTGTILSVLMYSESVFFALAMVMSMLNLAQVLNSRSISTFVVPFFRTFFSTLSTDNQGQVREMYRSLKSISSTGSLECSDKSDFAWLYVANERFFVVGVVVLLLRFCRLTLGLFNSSLRASLSARRESLCCISFCNVLIARKLCVVAKMGGRIRAQRKKGE